MDQEVRNLPSLAHVYYSAAELNEGVIKRWRELEERALENNIYLSPDFVIPALKYLTPEADIVIVTVDEYAGGQPQMIALGVFESRKGNLYFPFPFLCAYRSRHSFLTGVLVDESRPERAMNLLFSRIKESGKWRAVQFDWRPVNKLAENKVNEVLRENGIRWHQSGQSRRAILIPDESGSEYLDGVLSGRAKKTFNRRRRQLMRLGTLEWRFVQDKDRMARAIRDFLALENSGWKRKNGGSMASLPSDMKFFMTVVNNLAARRKVFFTEFRLNGEVISSTCNFISGRTGFAFKLGWDERFAKQGLGLLSEFELVKRAPEVLSYLEFIDSGTLPGSYLERLWTERRTLVSGFYSLRPFAAAYLILIELLRNANITRKRLLPLLAGVIASLVLYWIIRG